MSSGATNARVAVVILNYNAPADTLRCVESFRRLHTPGVERVIVDNASTDDSVAQIRSRFPGETLLAAERNGGYSAGNNLGMRYALDKGFEHVLIVNNDTEVVNLDFLRPLVDEMGRDPRLGIAGPMVLNPGEKLQKTILAGAGLVRQALASPRWVRLRRAGPDYTRPQTARALSGVCLLLRTDMIRRIGLFDEDFFMYGEELEYCHRARKAGWRIRYLPVESIVHLEAPGRSNEGAARRYVYGRRNMVLFLVKYGHPWQARLASEIFLRVCRVKIRRGEGGAAIYNEATFLRLQTELKRVLKSAAAGGDHA